MTGPKQSSGGRSIATRLRWGSVLVVTITVLIAAVVTVVLVRSANESDARQEVTRLAEANARQVAESVRKQLSDDGNAGNIPSLADLLQESLALQNVGLVRVHGNTVVGLTGEARPTAPPLNGRLGLAALNRIIRNNGTDFVVTSDNWAVAGAAVDYTTVEQRLLRLNDDVIVVVAIRPLGTAGLGPAGPALLIAGALALIGGWALSELLARRLRRPLGAVAATARAISEGDRSARVDVPRRTDRELAQVAEAVNDMADRLAQTDAARERFLVDVSHEFRTPLTSISGYAELLETDAITEPDEVRDAVEIIRNEAERLISLTDDLLTEARFEAGEIHLDQVPVDLADVVGESVAAIAPRAATLGVEVNHHTHPVTVTGDRLRLGQVVGNLVDNAIGFAAQRVEVTVEADGTHGVVMVADDGPGLGDDAGQIFQRSFTTERKRDRQGHLGIGLAVVSTLVEAMGGSVHAANGPDGGARFEVRIPLDDPQAAVTPT